MGLFDALRKKTLDFYEDDADYNDGYDYEEEEGYVHQKEEYTGVVQPFRDLSDMQMIVSAPGEFKKGLSIADEICQLKFVILNLSNMESGSGARLLDFLSGVAYSKDSKVHRIASNTYLIAPDSVELIGNI